MKIKFSKISLICFFFLFTFITFSEGFRIADDLEMNEWVDGRVRINGDLAYEKTFEGGSFISVWFKDFNLQPGDFVTISNYDGSFVQTLTHLDKQVGDSENGFYRINHFCSRVIHGPSTTLRFYVQNPDSRSSFFIEKICMGYQQEEVDRIYNELETRAICGSDDKKWAKCYTDTIYNKSKAVCRLYISGSSACTGWLVGSEGHIMTNNHCISTTSAANNTEYEFMGEGATCTTDCSGWLACRGTIESTTATLIKTSSTYDYSLLKLPTNVISKYGYMQLREAGGTVGERIYIPQHPGAKGKQIAVADDQSSTGFGKITGTSGVNFLYMTDTEGGSSGSPVLAYSDHLVVALHHLGGCDNAGVKINNVITDLGSLLPANAIGGNDTITADFTYIINPFPNHRKVDFTDTSTSTSTITKWSWTFGDGSTSTLKNPSRTYAAAGTYSVKLTVTNSNNNSNSVTKSITITEPAPIQAKFSYTANGKAVTFTDESITSGTIQSWLWEFGDGSTSTVQNPSRTYVNFGTYTVKLTVSDNIPSTNSISKTIILEDVPPTPCASAGTDYSYFWFSNIKLGTLDNTSAGDGYKDFSKTVAAPELKKGSTYTLTMTLNTAQYTNWFKAYIDYNRDGDFEDAGEVIYVSAAAGKIQSDGGPITIPSTAVKGLTWMRVQVKNSTSSNLPAPEPCETFAYGEVEDYYVNITDDCSTPTANFTFTVNQCTASFISTSTSTDPIVSYSWTFGNGTTSTLANPSCTYGANGNYNVSLTVTNSCGKSASISKTVPITNCTPTCPYDHLVGSFPNIGIWLRDSQTAAWTQLSKQQADIIRLGDVNGNGLDDIAALFKSTGKLWYRYDSGIWEDIPASAATLIAFDLRDMNNDNIEDLVGSWSDKGLWWRNNANGVWTKLSNMVPTLVASGDFDGDSKADVVGLFPSLSSIWIYFSNNTWKQISKQINLVDLRVGNMDSDVKAELVGSWDIGVWTFDPETNNWVQHHKKQAKQIAVGDINAGCMQDIVGYWDAATPLFVKFLETNIWKELSKYNPDTIDAGRVK